MTRILFAWNASGIGGHERRMASVCAELQLRGHSVTHFIRTSASATPLEVLLTKQNSGNVVTGGFTSLLKSTMKLKPDATIGCGLPVSLALRLFKAMMIIDGTLIMPRPGLDYDKKGIYFKLDEVGRRYIDKYLTNSNAATESLFRVGVPVGRVAEIPSALEGEWFERLNWDYEPGNIAMVGNSRPEKNQAFGVRAFFESSRGRSLTVYTDDSTKLRELERELRATEPLSKQVTYIENHILLPEDYDRFQVVMHPSVSESLPRVVLEAQARGRQVLASHVGSIPEWVPEENCLPPRDSGIWGKALDRLILAAYTPELALRVQPRRPISVSEYADEFLKLLVVG